MVPLRSLPRVLRPLRRSVAAGGNDVLLGNNGVDTRTIQAYLGHRNIMHTVRYTQLAPDRFRTLWRD